MDDSTAALEQSGLLENALKVGQVAPDFSLPNVFSKRIQLSNLLQSGPVVLAFYRGAWCPYCNMQLRALQLSLPKFRALGASLIAVSPQQPDHALSLSEKHALEYDVLFDAGNEVARAFGLAFTLPSALRELYKKMNINLPEQNGADTWELPFAATYVIEPGFMVRLVSVNADYTQRLEPSEIVAALRELHG
jgi:peroxiredoxin